MPIGTAFGYAPADSRFPLRNRLLAATSVRARIDSAKFEVNYPAVDGGACRWTPAHASDEAGENSPFAFNVPDFRAS